MLKKIYLPNDDTSLKEIDINFSNQEVLDFINNKSIELGAKVNSFSTILGSPIELKDNERLSKKIYTSWGISRHDFLRGRSYPNHKKYEIIKIFTNEEPIIDAMIDISQLKKSSLQLFLDRNILWKYIDEFEKKNGYDIKSFFDKNYIEMLSLERLYEYKNNLQLVSDFINLFKLNEEKIISYEDIEQYLKQNIHYKSVRSFQKEFLYYSKKEFEYTKDIAEKNEKILNLVK